MSIVFVRVGEKAANSVCDGWRVTREQTEDLSEVRDFCMNNATWIEIYLADGVVGHFYCDACTRHDHNAFDWEEVWAPAHAYVEIGSEPIYKRMRDEAVYPRFPMRSISYEAERLANKIKELEG